MRSRHPVAVLASVAALVALAASGCSSVDLPTDPDSPTVAYREADSAKALEVPPDLTRPSSAGQGYDIPRTGDGRRPLLPAFEGVDFVRSQQTAWLEVEGTSAEELWSQLGSFLRSQGLQVQRRDPTSGVVISGWAKRQEGPRRRGIGGWINSALGFLGSGGVRDQYRLRVERMQDPPGSRVFVSHRSGKEEAIERGRDVNEFEWREAEGDPAIEAEMTRRLLIFLGVGQDRARRMVASSKERFAPMARYVESDEEAEIAINGADYRRTFVRVGNALREVGAEVKDARQDLGRYRVVWAPSEANGDDDGFWIFGGSDDSEPRELAVVLRPTENGVRIYTTTPGDVPSDAASGATGKTAATGGIYAKRSSPADRALLRRLTKALGGTIRVERDREGTSSQRPQGQLTEPPD